MDNHTIFTYDIDQKDDFLNNGMIRAEAHFDPIEISASLLRDINDEAKSKLRRQVLRQVLQSDDYYQRIVVINDVGTVVKLITVSQESIPLVKITGKRNNANFNGGLLERGVGESHEMNNFIDVVRPSFKSKSKTKKSEKSEKTKKSKTTKKSKKSKKSEKSKTKTKKSKTKKSKSKY